MKQQERQKRTEEKIKWHDGFYGGLEWELRSYKEYLTFIEEHKLSQESLWWIC